MPGGFTSLADVLTIGRQSDDFALIAILTRAAGDGEVSISSQRDHEFLGVIAKFSLKLAFGAAARANTARLRRIDIGEAKLHAVETTAIPIRPIDRTRGRTGDGIGLRFRVGTREDQRAQEWRKQKWQSVFHTL